MTMAKMMTTIKIWKKATQK